MFDAAPSHLNSARAWTIDLAGCAIAGLVLGVVGPFGSFFNDTLPVRVAYWIIVCLLSGLTVGLSVRAVWPRAARRGVSVWLWVPAMILLVSVPQAAAARLVAVAFWPRIREAVGPLEWWGQTLLIIAVYTTLYVIAHARAAGPRSAPPVEEEGRLLDRLPSRLGRELLCLQMEDHYVRLHTPGGSTLVLSSMGRAIQQVGETPGLRVHRSWWVARHAVEAVVQDGRNLRLRLTSGIEAPVARAKVAALRAAGWLD